MLLPALRLHCCRSAWPSLSTRTQVKREEVVVEVVEDTLSPEQVEEINQMFNLYDKDGSGFIGYQEFEEAMKNSGMDKIEISQLFEDADENQDRQISSDEFLVLMKSTGLYS